MADPTILALFVAQSLNDAAPEGAIAEAERSIGRALPPGYRAFLGVSDGYDDVVGKGHLSLWPAGQLALRNDMLEVSRRIADLVLIGSDGGGIVYGIEWAGGTPQFVRVPFASMQRDEVRVLAGTFEDFVRLVASGDAG
jgi:hypothetical protein